MASCHPGPLAVIGSNRLNVPWRRGNEFEPPYLCLPAAPKMELASHPEHPRKRHTPHVSTRRVASRELDLTRRAAEVFPAIRQSASFRLRFRKADAFPRYRASGDTRSRMPLPRGVGCALPGSENDAYHCASCNWIVIFHIAAIIIPYSVANSGFSPLLPATFSGRHHGFSLRRIIPGNTGYMMTLQVGHGDVRSKTRIPFVG